jgi:hypothetical protein
MPIYQRASDAKLGIKAIFFFPKRTNDASAIFSTRLGLTGHPDVVLIDARSDKGMRKGAMAHLDKPVLPPMLYRYRSIPDMAILNRELKAIKEQYIWASRYKEMNDPMEGFYEPSSRVLGHSEFANVARNIVSQKLVLGLCSFCDSKDNELMWAHYASNYKGVAVGYRTTVLLQGLSDDAHLVRMSYGGVPPPIGIHDIADGHDAAIRILSHKKASWGYEREWRVIGQLGRLDINAKGCVRELYLGSRMFDSHKSKVLSELASTSIRIFEMGISGYTHKWIQIKGLK